MATVLIIMLLVLLLASLAANVLFYFAFAKAAQIAIGWEEIAARWRVAAETWEARFNEALSTAQRWEQLLARNTWRDWHGAPLH